MADRHSFVYAANPMGSDLDLAFEVRFPPESKNITFHFRSTRGEQGFDKSDKFVLSISSTAVRVAHLDQGKIEIKRGRFAANPKELLDGAPEPTAEGPGESTAHIQNFFDCMRSREKPSADVETGHRSTTLCHLVNICRELGRRLHWDPKAERFLDDDEANQLLSRPRRKGYELPEVV